MFCNVISFGDIYDFAVLRLFVVWELDVFLLRTRIVENILSKCFLKYDFVDTFLHWHLNITVTFENKTFER